MQNDTNMQEQSIKNITYICVLLSVKSDIHKKNINIIVTFHSPCWLNEQEDLKDVT